MKKDNPFGVDLTKAPKDKIFYNLVMFPYPSGVGLHVGHAMNYTASDIIARFKRMQWFTVLNPIGRDSFGLPTENFAMKVGKPASEVTQENIANFIEQCELMDRSYDWDRELATSSPEYYKWTQWIFQQLFKAGLVYRKEAFVNRCPHDQTVLANDQVVNGKCERCDTEIVQKKHMQRFIKITHYAERLINDLDTVDRPEETKTQQKYWIGKSEGAEIDFSVERKDTLKGNVFFLHWLKNDATDTLDGWIKRTKDILSWKGYDASAPFIDNSREIDAKGRQSPLEDYKDKITSDTILIGHSAWAASIVRWLSHNKKVRIKKLILVAPGYIAAEDSIAGIKDLYDFQIDPTLKERVTDGIYVLTSNDHERLLQSADIYVSTLWATHIKVEGRRHFNRSYWPINNTLLELLPLIESQNKITVFTTRPDTIYGVTAIVLAPENESIDSLLSTESKKALEAYRKATGKKTALERQQDAEERSGIFSGISATHPLTQEQVPVWYADYVLPDYATGAVMFVPAHDERDWAFAKKHGLAIKQVIVPENLNIKRWHAMMAIHKEISRLATENNIAIYLAGSICIPFLQGVLYRDHNDLDYIVKENKSEEFKDILLSNGFTLNKKRYQATYEVQKNDVMVEVGGVDMLPDALPLIDKDYKEDVNSLRGYEAKTLSFEYIKKFKEFLCAEKTREKDNIDIDFVKNGAYTGSWILLNSWDFDGLINEDAKKKIIDHLEKNWLGKRKVTYKLRDRSVSRQRYWGSPIPVYYDEAGNPQLIPEDELPVILPLDLGNYKPAGKSPLADHPTFPHYTAKDGKTYLRECDTLDTFMCSSFYYLRFIDPTNEKELVSKELADKTMPVDFYMGGKEHTYGHLLYSRFINKFLFDQGYISNPEPFQKLSHQWFVLGPDGRKMSKRRGNVITPGDLAQKYGHERGIDTLRTYVMFMWPLEIEKAWNDNAVEGVKKFLERAERLEQFITAEAPSIDSLLHKTIKWVTDDIERLKFNTAVSKLMVFVNDVYEKKQITKAQLSSFFQLLAPFATKLTEQMRKKLGNKDTIHLSSRPVFDVSKIAQDSISLPVQIAGKMKGTIEVESGISEDDVLKQLQADERFAGLLEWKEIVKVIYVQDKIINIIVK